MQIMLMTCSSICINAQRSTKVHLTPLENISVWNILMCPRILPRIVHLKFDCLIMKCFLMNWDQASVYSHMQLVQKPSIIFTYVIL